jgi:mono/diheme cytochrome c family protein
MTHRLMVSSTVILLSVSTIVRAADDGATLYKAKCAACHGANGEGKPAVKAPAVKGTKLEAGQIVEQVTKGEPTSKAPHNKGMAGLTGEQAQVIAEYIKTLK